MMDGLSIRASYQSTWGEYGDRRSPPVFPCVAMLCADEICGDEIRQAPTSADMP